MFDRKHRLSGAYLLVLASSAVDAHAKDEFEGASAIVRRQLKVAHGSVVRVDQAAELIVIKTSAGAEDTFELARHVVVDAGRGVERGATPTCRAVEKGGQVAISYSEQAGKKTAVFVKRT